MTTRAGLMRGFCTVATTVVAVVAVTSSVWADVTVVSEITTKGLPAGIKGNAASSSGKPTIATTYYKGDKQRVETGDSITITDYTTGKTTALDVKKKTYTIRNAEKVEGNPFLEAMKMEVTADMKATAEKKTIVEKNARRYDYNAVMKMTMDGVDPTIASMLPTIMISGQQWTTEDIPYKMDVAKVARVTMLRSLPPMMAKGVKEISEKLAMMKGFPLSSVVTLKFALSKDAPAEFASRIPKDAIVTTTEVKSIVQTPLDEALFTIPEGYSEVKDVAPDFGPSGPNGPQ